MKRAAATEAKTKVKRAEIEDAPEVSLVFGSGAVTVRVRSVTVMLAMPEIPAAFAVATTAALN